LTISAPARGMMAEMKRPPTVDQMKRTIAELPRDERVELTQWMLQRYIAGGASEGDEGSEPHVEATHEAAFPSAMR
jgi:hypothetical protein